MRSNKPYVPLDPAVIEQARQIDLLTYLRDCEPSNLVKVKGTSNVYCTAEHDSLKISNGKWYWWSRGFGGVSALDYLMKVRGFGFAESIEILTGREFSYVPPPTVSKEQKEKVLLLPDRYSNNEQVIHYLFGRGIDLQIIQECIDLPRKVKYRPRYKQSEFKVDRGCRIGRSNYTLCRNQSHASLFTDANTSASVIEIINLLDKVLGAKIFSHLFPVILTDNGSEFSNPKEIEKRSTIPCSRTKIFYCDPSAPYQKGACEVNHELIRRILPKGSSFDELTQQDIFLMMNHINSYKRKKLNNRSPYETFSFYYGEDVLKKLGCSPVAAENIILKPKLLKK